MSHRDLYIANSKVISQNKNVEGEYVYEGDEMLFKISNYDEMRAFFMTIVSPSDHWLFISSNGGLSAGRKNTSSSLFPYYTHDKIIDSAEITGSKSIFRVLKGRKNHLWEPFSDRYLGIYAIQRNLYKGRKGNKIIFEEINNDLGLTFRYHWTFSNKYGFVKKSTVLNNSSNECEIELVDGVQNILPYGLSEELQNSKSNLVDAYKKNELDKKSGIGIYSLSAMIIDKAEASETLAASTAWSAGINVDFHLLSSLQLNHFRKGLHLKNEDDIRAERGAYFIKSTQTIASNKSLEWYIVSEVNQSLSSIINLKKELGNEKNLIKDLEKDIDKGNDELFKLVNMADGVQISQDKLINGRHFSNVLFNIMRGGVFTDQYDIHKADLLSYIEKTNKECFSENSSFLFELDEILNYSSLLEEIEQYNNLDLERICLEYLPLSFSRRHGDPSRPWNEFSIEVNDDKGNKIKNYQGNWRDIFQNWEALALSFPNYIEGMLIKFLNASTIDGYNPYRITHDGIDWEIVDENDPWAYIGYWGDHQIIYLLKLLELSSDHHPGKLKNILNKKIAVYANVPYRIKSYDKILSNSSDTIEYNHDLERVIYKRIDKLGSDGKMIFDKDEKLRRASLAEKLLLTAFTKLYNFIPEAGIWLNTQRPEWNDANNALVGNGTSMVTLYYLHRYLNFCIDLFKNNNEHELEINDALFILFCDLNKTYTSYSQHTGSGFSDKDRKKMMDELGAAGERYRNTVYSEYDLISRKIKSQEILDFLSLCNRYLAQSIKANKREDSLYNAYNLIDVENGEVDYLYEMLEGQVGVLSAGYLATNEALELLEALKRSKLFRPDQYSYLLYPDRELATFLEKNNIPKSFSDSSSLLKKLHEEGELSLVEKDSEGTFHFNWQFHNADDLKKSLEELTKGSYKALVEEEYSSILEVFEKMFDHKSFTGRSGTFYAFEGLGSIYWHMVSKLLLAVQENITKAIDEGANSKLIGKLIDHYYEIRAGIGINKSPDLYGAFPTDAYSHTPGNAGAQQPGMTGQVKEDIINRWVELGVVVKEGKIHFQPSFLKKEEFLEGINSFPFFNFHGEKEELELPKNSLAFTLCQTPILYCNNGKDSIEVHLANGVIKNIKGKCLDLSLSTSLFNRDQEIKRIIVNLGPF